MRITLWLGALLLAGAAICALLLYLEQSRRGWGAEKSLSVYQSVSRPDPGVNVNSND